MLDKLMSILPGYEGMSVQDQINVLNDLKLAMHSISPFKNEPVDCVLWVKGEAIKANDYNPNAVAPPEMKLLEESVREDHYTQPIVSMLDSELTDAPTCDLPHIVVDGFHRNRVGREVEDIRERMFGYLPIVQINQGKEHRSNRMASTIRHNRARGTHNIELMSTIVTELVEMGKGDAWICKHIGMSADELLRMKQITGLASLFKNQDFSESWVPDAQSLY